MLALEFMNKNRNLMGLLFFAIFLNVLIGAGLYYFSDDSQTSFSVTNSSKIVAWINTENDIEVLRDIAYRKHISANSAESFQSKLQRNLASLFIGNSLLFGYIVWFLRRQMNSNKALQSDAAKPRR